MNEECLLCTKYDSRPSSHAPIPKLYCHCGKATSEGCPKTHHHSVIAGCDHIWDIRKCRFCETYLHKECSKDGLDFRVHSDVQSETQG